MSGNDLTEEEKNGLIEEVTKLTEEGVIKRMDYAMILDICLSACQRRIDEIDGKIGKPVDIIQ